MSPSVVSQATYTLEVGPVSFDPVPGTAIAGTLVSLSTVTVGATIRYRTDGADPTCGTGELYDASGPGVALTQDTEFRAVGCRAGYDSSAVAVGDYQVVP